MKTVKRIVFWLLLVEFVAACIWWTFTFPYRPERLYGLIPEEARLLTDHAQLGSRWSELARCPTLRTALQAAGADAKMVAALDGPAVRRALTRFCPRRTLVAWVPPGRAGASGWVVVTWAGRQAQFLRFGWMDRYLTGAQTVRLGGEKLWRWQGHGLPAGQTLSMAVHEGVVVACLSPDPTAALRLRSRALRAPVRPPWCEPPPEGWGATFAAAHDRAWVRVPGTPPWRIALTAVDAQGCRARVSGPVALPLRRCPDVDKPEVTALPIPPGAVALGAMSAADAAGWVARSTVPPPVKDAVGFVVERHLRTDAPLVVWVGSGDWSGRILSIRVPALFAAVPVRDGAAALAEATNVIDLLNAGLRTSYLPWQMQLEGRRLTVFGRAMQDQADVVQPAEKPAAAAVGPWVVFCTSAQTLSRALTAQAAGEAGGGGFEGGGAEDRLRGLDAAAGAGLWVDTAPAAEAARNLKAVYELWLVLRNPAKPPFSRRDLAKLDPWIERLAPLGEMRVDVLSGHAGTELALAIQTPR